MISQYVGAQTIPWGEAIRERMPEILSFLAVEGFRGVETGMRYFDTAQPEYYRELYGRHGIVPLGLHSGGQFWDPEAAAAERQKLWDAVDFAAAVGFKYVVVSGNKGETIGSMRTAARTYAQLGRRCRDSGLRFAYHNHNWELSNDATILSTLLEETTPDEVSLVLDIAWVHVSQTSLPNLLARVGDRVAYLHIKDVIGGKFVELGSGAVDLVQVIKLARESAIEWLVIEQDYTDYTPDESMRRNREYLRSLGV